MRDDYVFIFAERFILDSEKLVCLQHRYMLVNGGSVSFRGWGTGQLSDTSDTSCMKGSSHDPENMENVSKFGISLCSKYWFLIQESLNRS